MDMAGGDRELGFSCRQRQGGFVVFLFGVRALGGPWSGGGGDEA